MFFITNLCINQIHVAASRLQNVEQGKRDFLQQQFLDLHKSSEVQPHLNTFIISSGTKQISRASDRNKELSLTILSQMPTVTGSAFNEHLHAAICKWLCLKFWKNYLSLGGRLCQFRSTLCNTILPHLFPCIIWSFYFTLAITLRKKIYSLLQIILRKFMQKSSWTENDIFLFATFVTVFIPMPKYEQTVLSRYIMCCEVVRHDLNMTSVSCSNIYDMCRWFFVCWLHMYLWFNVTNERKMQQQYKHIGLINNNDYFRRSWCY